MLEPSEIETETISRLITQHHQSNPTNILSQKPLQSKDIYVIILLTTSNQKGIYVMKKIFEKYREQILYLFFGALTTAVNTITFFFLRKTNITPAIANIIALVISILFAYFTNRKWVFQSHTTGKNLMTEAISFFSARALTAIVDELLVVALIEQRPFQSIPATPLADTIIKVIINIIIILLNYIFSKRVIFAQKNKESS